MNGGCVSIGGALICTMINTDLTIKEKTTIRIIQKAPGIYDSKAHFNILDGLRGVAAVAVVIFHFMEFIVPDYHDNFIAHGYLAVDFFFCLSGFVIAYAYDNRIKKIGWLQFARLRLIRLQPLVVIGAILGLVTFVFDPFHNMYALFGVGKTLLMLLSSIFMIPFPMVPERYNNLFHFNPPTWSLFWEYIANIFYAMMMYRFSNKTLWTLSIIAAMGLCYISYHYRNLGVGWGAENFIGGGVRIFYSFIAGMLIYRLNWIIKSSIGFLGLSLLLVLVFLIPFVDQLNWILDPLIVIFYFPFLVALGAGSRLRRKSESVCRFSGEISYPLYMIHYPFLWVFLSYVETQKPAMNEMVFVMVSGTFMLIILSYFILKIVDLPLRSHFKGMISK